MIYQSTDFGEKWKGTKGDRKIDIYRIYLANGLARGNSLSSWFRIYSAHVCAKRKCVSCARFNRNRRQSAKGSRKWHLYISSFFSFFFSLLVRLPPTHFRLERYLRTTSKRCVLFFRVCFVCDSWRICIFWLNNNAKVIFTDNSLIRFNWRSTGLNGISLCTNMSSQNGRNQAQKTKMFFVRMKAQQN